MGRFFQPVALLGAVSALVCLAHADTVLVVHSDVSNRGNLSDLRVPQNGDYTFTFGKNRAHVSFPNGDVLLFDFDKKVVSRLNPSGKQFYQLKIGDLLSYGNRSPRANLSVQSQVNFVPTVGQDHRTILDFSATPYDLTLEALLKRQSSGSGFHSGFGRHRGGGGGGGGGGVFGGGDSSDNASGSFPTRGCKIGGELWMATPPAGDLDRDQANIALECALMWGSPDLKDLSDRVRKSNLLLVGGDYSLSSLTGQGEVTGSSPVISIKMTSVGRGALDPATMTIPSDYSKTDLPPGPLAG